MGLVEIILVVAAGIGIDAAIGSAAVGLASRPRDRGRLALAVAALALAGGCVAVILTFASREPATYVAIMKWVYFPASAVWLGATVWAVAFYTHWVPRRALTVLSAGLAAMVLLNVALPYGLLFVRADALELVQLLDSAVAYLSTPPSPLVLINDVLVAAALVFLIYAPLRAYRRSGSPAERRGALAVGSAAAVYAAAAVVDLLTIHVVVANPFLTVAGYVALLLVVVVALHVHSVSAARELNRHRAHLEELVAQRVKDLEDANRQLAAEAQRRQTSEAQYRLLAENASDMVFRASNLGVFEWVSPSVKQLVNWAPEQLVGRAARDFIHPDEAERFQAMPQAVSDSLSVTCEMRIRTADGEYRWISSSTRPLFDESGEVVGRVGSWRDAQAEVQARLALTESEERFRAAFDAVEESIGLLRPVLDAQGELVDAEILWANRLIRERWFGGRPLEDVRGARLLVKMSPASAERLREPFRAAALEDRASALPLTWRTDAGAEILVEAHVTPFPGGFALTTHEVTEEHRLRLAAEAAQERIRAMMDSLFDSHVFLGAARDAAGHVDGFVHRDANAAACALRGLSRDELIGSPLLASRSVCTVDELIHVLVSGTPLVIDDRAHRVGGADGQERRFAVRVVRVGDGVVETLRDVTDRHAAEQALRQRLAELAAVQRMSQLLVRRVELQPALQSVCTLLRTLYAARTVSIRQVTGQSQPTLEHVARAGEVDEVPSAREDAVIGEALLGHCQLQAQRQDGTRLLVVPLTVGDEALGALLVLRDAAAAPFNAAEQGLARTAADLVAAVMRSERMRALEKQAATEEERRRIARDLHDAVTQSIYSANLLAEGLPAVYARSPEKAFDDLLTIRRLIRAAFAELRILLFELRPDTLAVASLETLLQRLVDALAGRTETDVRLEVDPEAVLGPEERTAFYRIAQEALNNVAKHAGATRVAITVAREDAAVRLTVRDDGRGFDPALCTSGLGQTSMRERAAAIGAELSVSSAPWAGTTVTLVWRPRGAISPPGAEAAAPAKAGGGSEVRRL